ncbi:MAG TPA: carboxymuconolactone decarboxylase family protein [Phycisphaerae bacterium]|jgi:4-carboxymuconolactone decarboxylase|nr:carboxymuconolactone decarboxylase family protein [Phycisphaerae bacterium]
MSEDRSERGARILRDVHSGWGAPNILGPLEEIAPDLKNMVRDFAFGEIYARPGLDLKSRQLVTVAALAAMHHSPVELKAHLFGALKLGWKKEELVEALMQIALYSGFPAAVGALMVARDVFAEAERRDGKVEPQHDKA